MDFVLKGVVKKTIVRGHVVFDEGIFNEVLIGSFVQPNVSRNA